MTGSQSSGKGLSIATLVVLVAGTALHSWEASKIEKRLQEVSQGNERLWQAATAQTVSDFNARYREIRKQFQDLRESAQVTAQQSDRFWAEFWRLQEDQFLAAKTGALPMEIFAHWTNYRVRDAQNPDYVVGGKSFTDGWRAYAQTHRGSNRSGLFCDFMDLALADKVDKAMAIAGFTPSAQLGSIASR